MRLIGLSMSPERARYTGLRNTTTVHGYESLANDYKAKRNRAIVLQAECTAKLGQRDQAATLFINALNLLSIDDTEWWDRARAGLYGFIDVK